MRVLCCFQLACLSVCVMVLGKSSCKHILLTVLRALCGDPYDHQLSVCLSLSLSLYALCTPSVLPRISSLNGTLVLDEAGALQGLEANPFVKELPGGECQDDYDRSNRPHPQQLRRDHGDTAVRRALVGCLKMLIGCLKMLIGCSETMGTLRYVGR